MLSPADVEALNERVARDLAWRGFVTAADFAALLRQWAEQAESGEPLTLSRAMALCEGAKQSQ